MQRIQTQRNPRDLSNGLTAAEVLQARESYGSNQFTEQKRKSFFRRFLSNLNDPIIRILIGAMVISAFLLLQDGCLSEVLGIGAAILISTLVSTLSECGSERAFRTLQEESNRVQCTVVREGRSQSLPISELVVGDVVILEAGEQIPADGYLFFGELTVDQSAINGESREVSKRPNTDFSAPLDAQLAHGLLRGSRITAGQGRMLVKHVGDHTLYGSMAAELREEGMESPLKTKLNHLAKVISRIGYVSAMLVMAADLIYSFFLTQAALTPLYIAQNLIHAFTLGITVIVVAVPEGLPMMITVVLSANMRKMMKDHVMVRKGVGIETAGGMQILFTDKTGTLTCGQPKLRAYITADGKENLSLSAVDPQIKKLLVLNAIHNTSASVTEQGISQGNATDRLLLSEASFFVQSIASWRKTAFFPFQSAQRYSAATVTDGKETYTIFKGAPELLLQKCQSAADPMGRAVPFSKKENLLSGWHQLTRKGARVIVVAYTNAQTLTIPDELTFLAMLSIEDVLRKEAKGAIRDLHRAGVQVVMMTGDHPETAQSIAKACGILAEGEQGIVTGEVLQTMEDSEIAAALPGLRVIARALPQDKSRLVRIAQRKNYVVGMTGDGLNDAPALKAADVGFAMGNGTDVTKEASDIVILDNNIASVTRAVLYGRTIFRSIRKFITFQLTMNLCAVLLSMMAPFLGIDTPITVMQMLWINLIMDTLAGLAFAGEAPDPFYLRSAPIQRNTPVLTRQMCGQIGGMGVAFLSICLIALTYEKTQLWLCGTAEPLPVLTAFFTLFVFCGIFCAFYARSEKISVLHRLWKNPAFLWIMGTVLFVQLGMIRFGGSIFRTTPLPLRSVWHILCFAALLLPLEWARRILTAVFLPSKNR